MNGPRSATIIDHKVGVLAERGRGEDIPLPQVRSPAIGGAA